MSESPSAEKSVRPTDRWGIGAFVFGLVGLTALGLYATRSFTHEVCGALLGSGPVLQSISDKAHDALSDSSGVAENSTWALNQVGMCLNAGVLTGADANYPPTLGLAFVSMLLGLLGGTTALACRIWPGSSRTAPQLVSDAATGGSVGLALFALAGMLDLIHTATVVGVIGVFLVVCLWILRQGRRWLKTVLLLTLILSMLAVLMASVWPSQNAWQNVFAWCLVMGLLAAGALVWGAAVSLAQELIQRHKGRRVS